MTDALMQSTSSDTAVALLSPDAERTLLHPHYIVRVAGEPVELLATIDTGATARVLRESAALRRELRTRTPPACAVLERIVPRLSESDKRLSRRVLDLKRSIHNLRRPDALVLREIADQLEASDQTLVETVVSDIQALLALESSVPAVYQAEIDETARQLHNLWDRRNLQDGLSLSSPQLFRDYAAFFAAAGQGWSEKKKRNLEDTLVQYVARCATKTSPLSSFTLSSVGAWEECPAPSWQLAFGDRVEKRIEFKSGLFHHIFHGLLGNYARAKQLFPLRLNPSIEITESKARFRKVSEGNIVSGRTWGTGEALAELSVNPILQCIMHVFGHTPGESLRAGQLVDGVCRLAPKLQPAAVDAFLQRLYDVGFLLADVQRCEQTDLLAWGDGVLAHMPGAEWDAARAHVRALREHLGAFGATTPGQRAAIAHAVREHVGALAASLGVTVTPAMATPMFFENAYYTDARDALSAGALAPFQDDLDLLLRLAPLVDNNQERQCRFADFFLSLYGTDGVCRDPFTFIEKFDEIYGIARYGFVPKKELVAPPSRVSEALARAESALDDYLAPILESSHDGTLDRDALREVAELMPQAVVNRGASHSLLAQLSTSEGRPKLVVNQMFGGRSSLLSRFLELLPDAELARVREYLSRGTNDGVYAELAAVFGFNANRHPRLADAEISIPPYPPHWNETEKIALKDLALVYDAPTHRAMFRRADGRLLDIWYQGFLIPPLLPRTQRILATIGTEGPVNYVIGTVMKRRVVPSDRVTVIPRISVGDVVLSRRTYLVPRSLVPSPDLGGPEFFAAIHAWRDELGLPNEVFVRTSPISAVGVDQGSIADVNWNEFAFKNIKPFYVNFDSPRLVRLLARAMSRNAFPLILAEVLPDLRDQHVTVEGKKHVAEIHIEFTVPPRRHDRRVAEG